MRVLRHPRNRQLRRAATQLVGDAPELRDGGVLGRVEQALRQETHARQRTPAALGNAVRILAGEQPARQRAPGRQAQADVFVQPRVVLLDALAVEQVVLRLLHHRPVQVVLVGNVPGGANVVGRPLAGAPIERLALGNHVAHRTHGLLNGRVGVGAVAVDEVDEVEPHARERAVDRVHQVLAVQRVDAVRAARLVAARQAPEELGRDDVVQPRPLQRLERFAHHHLALAARIGLGVVEEVDAGVHRGGQHLGGGRRADLGVVRDPRAERESTHLQAAAAESSVFHEGAFRVGERAEATVPA